MVRLNKRKKNILLAIFGSIFFFYSCFKDRPQIARVSIDRQAVSYSKPHVLSKDAREFDLSFELNAKKYLKQYTVTICDQNRNYHPNTKNVKEMDGLRGRRIAYLEGTEQTARLKYTDLNLSLGTYEGEILVSDFNGYQTRFTFTLLVE